MNVPPLVPPAISPASLPALAGVNPDAAPIDVLMQPVIVSASIVDLSKLGQLLSASSMLQSLPISTDSADRVAEQGASTSLDDGFGKLLAAAQVFVDGFNQFQNAEVNDWPDPLTAPSQNALLLAMNELPASDTDTRLLASLAQVGINFQDGSNPTGSAQLTIDITALQAAFNADPARTSAALAQAFQTIGQIAATFASQNIDFFTSVANLTPPASPLDALPATAPPFLADDVSAPLQDVPVDQDDELANNPALAPTAAVLNAQIAAASLALPASSSDVIAGVNPAASPVVFPNAAAATLQSALADQALRDAFDVNLPAVPAAAAQPAAPVAITVTAAPSDAAPSAAIAPAGGALNATNQPVNAAPITTTGISTAQLPTPLVTLDDGRAPLALDPSVAAAVAAYRLGDGAIPANKPAQSRPETRTDISAVSKSHPAALDAHDDSGDARRNETARNAALALAENKALAATRFLPEKTVDLTR